MPKKVYIVIDGVSDYDRVYGVYSTLKDANDRVKKVRDDQGVFDDGGAHYQPEELQIYEARHVARFGIEYDKKKSD